MTDFFKEHSASLELGKVLEKLADCASCEDTRQRIYETQCSTDFDTVCTELLKTSDAHRVIARFGSPSVYGLKNVESGLARAKAGGILSMKEVLDVGEALRTTRAFVQFQKKWGDMETSLDFMFQSLWPDKDLEERIFGAIRSEEEMADNASHELSGIRKKIRIASGRIRDMLDGMVRSTHYQKYLQDTLVTMRDGRFVIPVKAEHRNEIKGLVHDTSSSGATLFVEPMGVVDANNDIRVLQAEEEAEITRILGEFSAEIGEISEQLRRSYELIIDIDVYFSKARLAYDMKAVVPKMNEDGEIDLIKARHPLINKDIVVPIDIRLGKEFDTLMITGPNTGGKTVALKTMGLLTLMAMAGMMVPAAEGSRLAVFEKVLADIGDEQSIEQSLSTFSAHITHIIKILDVADERSLVLLDELGAGTDPVEGAALATAILENLRGAGAKVAATTHYAELKVYALETRGVENASCEFDLASLRPTYKLLIGVPGRSNAFAISERLGIKSFVVERARELVSNDKTRFEDVVTALEEQRQQLEEERENARLARIDLEKQLHEVKNSNQILEQKREKEMEKARAEARALVEKVQAEANVLIDELNRIRKEKDSEKFRNMASQARSSINTKIDAMAKDAIPPENKNAGYKLPRPLKQGDTVLLVDINKKGTVLDPPDNSGMVTVQAGIIKTKVKVSALRLEEESKVSTTANGGTTRTVKSKSNADIAREVDVRGMNSEEAIMAIDTFLANSYFSSVNTLTIIHGKGTGKLRSAVHQFLKRHKNVRTFRLGVFGEGESGVTIVETK